MKAKDRFNQLMDWMDETCKGQRATLLVGPTDRYAFMDITIVLGGFPEMLDICFVGQWTRSTALVIDGKMVVAPEKT